MSDPLRSGSPGSRILGMWMHDEYGMAYPASADIESMSWPMRCLRCNKVHDAGKVTPTGRYSDCTVWRCPNCKAEIDDRAGGYGGAERVAKRGNADA